jgi:type IV fimbrial biogenesis protein FimT
MRAAGFTLIELLVTIALAAILGALAIPDLRRAVADAAVTSAANQTLAALQLARRTALATGTTVTLCPTSDEHVCDMRGRSWMMFANGATGVESRREAAEPVLRRWPLPRGVMVTGTRGYAAYLPQPRAAATLTFTFCHGGHPALRRSIVVSQTGRPRLSVPASTAVPSTCP